MQPTPSLVMDQRSNRSLLSLRKPSSRRANPLDPPPGLPPYPGELTGRPSERILHATVRPWRNSARGDDSRPQRSPHLTQRSAPSSLWARAPNYPSGHRRAQADGASRPTQRCPRHRRLAQYKAGLVVASLVPTRTGKSYLCHHRRLHVSLVITLTTAGTARRTVKLVIP